MAVCAGSEEYSGPAMAGDYVYIYPPEWGAMNPADCKYKLLTPQEFQEISSASDEMNALILPLALVVIFVLGWIAGAQR